ncbi:MAG: PaaX family transcriptional regulator [Thalassolituus sp. CG17_big_fil_post_rev_8_21_14_2_50_53_8]|nr:MAG: PaaX family transcriptional regulator [Thalassolituus sp. CG17_big_fil_post_rev_8_21_14_2_50_53_8]
MQLQPKPLILKLLLAADGQQLSARDAISAGALFDIAENHIRVALTRLTAEGLIEATARGQYQLTPRAWTLAGEIRGWRESVAQLQPWSGQWLAVHCAGLGRSDRKQLAVRERALALCGCAELERELYLRPDNLAGSSEALRIRLQKLGEEQMVFQLSGLDSVRQQRAVGLWDCSALNNGYRQQTQILQEWLQRVPELSLEQAARESFLLGDEAIRQMVFDPLLPAGLIDAEARALYLNVLLEYDRVGHDIWQALYQQSNRSQA